jgi:hypothetical protein
VFLLPGLPGVYQECLPEVVSAVQEGEGCEGEDKAVKCASCVLLVALLCSCTAHRESGEGADSEGLPERLPFLDRANPLVERTFEVMEKRAWRSEQRELLRAEGRRVCEEGESRTHWEENCKNCWCDGGVLFCDLERTGCSEPSSTWSRADWERYEMEKAERRSGLREYHRNRGRRVCEEGEDGTRWQEGCETCWCEAGSRACTTRCARTPTPSAPPPPYKPTPLPNDPQ